VRIISSLCKQLKCPRSFTFSKRDCRSLNI